MNPDEIGLRIEKGHAEPEELAAIKTLILARLQSRRDSSARHLRGSAAFHARKAHRRPSACWAGCWAC
ncbi:acyl-CoA carboxylase subunit epsilon [Streptomyces sp. H27-C3]|uniref:acyl-CoA carboxylase subunit epsilon n=1 Tax=Streptomyces sp. H27-C3 TaxID=3046305 RepID=UPI0024B978D0|nr:acyl-CoA carboxylase subunit epsilon [Streptomyces sp. H27-C3]MDJ0462070.1 acyl-CoA carboxylase subunit epsilon [Streptomyces sp. H27-C3]